MRRGFNKYPLKEEDDSSSENPSDQNNIHPFGLNFGLSPPFSTVSNSSGYNDGMIMALFQIVQQQSRALQTLVSKVQSITQKTLDLTEKIKDLKKGKQDEREYERAEERRVGLKGETLKGRGDIIEANALVRILFGEEKKYQYRLQLAERLELPLYRQRNFFLDIELRDFQGKLIRNCNKIPLSLALYSSQNPPKFIEKNTAGQKILKGYVQQSLHQGSCRFQKIQIKQVTSHFRNGWVFIVIIPSMTPLGSVNPSQDNFIDYTKIEPLVLDKIIVKAKKLKQRKQVGGNQREGQQEIEDQAKLQEQIYSQEK